MNAPADTPDDEALERGFRLDELTIDPQSREVSGPGGRERLDPKGMAMLVVLARNAGHVVPREDLLARLWPDTAVSDDALSRCLYELRRQLGQAGGDDRYKAMLETVPKRGYRLNGQTMPITPRPDVPSQAQSNWPFAILAAALVLAAAAWFSLGKLTRPDSSPRPATPMAYSLAVLPFVDLSSAQDQGHFSDGVSEEILNRLNQTRTLRVIARTSSFSFRGDSTSIPEIARILDVTHVLEGSVRKADNRVRITARLVEASSNSQVWSETYDRELGDLFATQDVIAGEVATALRATLRGAAARSPPPESEAAHDLFLRGEFFYNRRAPDDIALAVKYYEKALAIEPGYARAWAALAGAYSLLAYSGELPRDTALAKQGEAARRAVALDPGLAVGHARLSQYHWDIGDRESGYEIWDTARALDPDDPLILNFTAGLAMRAGDIDVGIKAQRRLVARDPLSASYHANLGTYLLARDEFAEAKSELQKAKDLNPNFGWQIDLAIARVLIMEKQYDDARSMIEGLPDGEGRDHGLALLYHATGRSKDADQAVARLVAQSTNSPDIRLAEVHAFRGSTEAAFDALQGLQVAIDRDEPALVSQVWSWQLELRVSPFLKSLHSDPRWERLLTEPASAGS